ncbi:MAG: hypothetical protein JXQ73_22895 [Phycisphaerae bacterium]|nr:hypothetical protein [Phycisphaerae bacterium]
MAPDRCPREDPLKAMSMDSVFEVPCPNCGYEVEFIADEKRHKCAKCGEQIPNPKLAGDKAK